MFPFSLQNIIFKLEPWQSSRVDNGNVQQQLGVEDSMIIGPHIGQA